MSHLTLIPAYGRDYKNQKDLKADWESDKDFLVAGMGSGYINRTGARQAKVATVNVRYQQARKVCVIKV